MLEPKQPTPKPILRQVIGWVVVLPLIASFVRLPYPLSLSLSLGVMALAFYGANVARRHASRRVTVLAYIIAVLNVVCFFAMSTPSLLKALYDIAWHYLNPYYANWVYWNF